MLNNSPDKGHDRNAKHSKQTPVDVERYAAEGSDVDFLSLREELATRI